MEQADQLVCHLREAFADDEELAWYEYPNLGVREHIELEDNGRAHVGIAFELPAAAAFTWFLKPGLPVPSEFP